MKRKYEELKRIISGYEKLLVAFSGGVDSTFLLKTAKKVLGENVTAVTMKTAFFPEAEYIFVKEFCETEGIRLITVEKDILSVAGVAENPKNRCYICKRNIFSNVLSLASDEGIAYVAEGSNMDDLSDYRPGHRAIEELGIKSPLQDAGLYKSEIRELSKELGLETWCKPSFACLATRFVTGEKLEKSKLKMVEQAEEFMSLQGFTQYRVRMHGNDLARIEVPENELEKLLRQRQEIVERFKEIGYRFVSMDMAGYKMGNMNK